MFLSMKRLVLLALSFLTLASCSGGGASNSSEEIVPKSLVLSASTVISDSEGSNCFRSKSGDSFWFSYQDVSKYKPLNSETGFIHLNSKGSLYNSTPFDSLLSVVVTLSKEYNDSSLPIHFYKSDETEVRGDPLGFYHNDNDTVYIYSIYDYYSKDVNYFTFGGVDNDFDPLDIIEIEIKYIKASSSGYRYSEFEENDTGYSLKKCKGLVKKYTVPDQYNGKPVTEIAPPLRRVVDK